jgi:hypothetical protein
MALKLTPEKTAEEAPAPPPELQAPPPAQAEARPADGPLTVTLTLEGVFKEWLKARALDHREEPGEHAAALLRAYWAHHDTWRHRQAGTLTVRREG